VKVTRRQLKELIRESIASALISEQADMELEFDEWVQQQPGWSQEWENDMAARDAAYNQWMDAINKGEEPEIIPPSRGGEWDPETGLGVCITEDAPVWQSFIGKLKAVGAKYEQTLDYGDDVLAIKMKYEDVMDIQPSGLRAIMKQVTRSHPGYMLITDYQPRSGWFDAPLDRAISYGEPSTNDIVIALSTVEDVEEQIGGPITQRDIDGWPWITREEMNRIPGPGC